LINSASALAMALSLRWVALCPPPLVLEEATTMNVTSVATTSRVSIQW